MKIGEGVNEYGTPISFHICDTCGAEFEICRAIPDGKPGWENCLGPDCPSYDPERDVDKMLENGEIILYCKDLLN